MLQLIRNKYVIAFFLLYSIAIAVLIQVFHQPFMDIVTPFLFFGILFSFIAWLLVKNSAPLPADKPVFKGELIVIITLVLFFTWYVTYGSSTINKLIPLSIIEVEWKNTIAIVIKKLLVFVLLPFLLYKVAGFSVKDFGLAIDRKKYVEKKRSLFLLFCRHWCYCISISLVGELNLFVTGSLAVISCSPVCHYYFCGCSSKLG